MSSKTARSTATTEERARRPGKQPSGGRSTFQCHVSRYTFNAVMDSITALSKARQKYHTYQEAIRVELDRLKLLNRTDLLILYKNYNQIRRELAGRLPEMVTITISLTALDRSRVIAISELIWQITDERLSQATIVVLLLLGSGQNTVDCDH